MTLHNTSMATEPKVKGVVQAVYPNSIFDVTLEDGREIKAHISGKMRFHHIHIVIGDKVEVVLDPYGGTTTNKITKRI